VGTRNIQIMLNSYKISRKTRQPTGPRAVQQVFGLKPHHAQAWHRVACDGELSISRRATKDRADYRTFGAAVKGWSGIGFGPVMAGKGYEFRQCDLQLVFFFLIIRLAVAHYYFSWSDHRVYNRHA